MEFGSSYARFYLLLPSSVGLPMWCMKRRRLFWWRFGRFLRDGRWRNARNRLRGRLCRRLGYLGFEHSTSIIAQSVTDHAAAKAMTASVSSARLFRPIISESHQARTRAHHAVFWLFLQREISRDLGAILWCLTLLQPCCCRMACGHSRPYVAP